MLWKGDLYSWWIKKQILKKVPGGTPSCCCLASLQAVGRLSIRQCGAVARRRHTRLHLQTRKLRLSGFLGSPGLGVLQGLSLELHLGAWGLGAVRVSPRGAGCVRRGPGGL